MGSWGESTDLIPGPLEEPHDMCWGGGGFVGSTVCSGERSCAVAVLDVCRATCGVDVIETDNNTTHVVMRSCNICPPRCAQAVRRTTRDDPRTNLNRMNQGCGKTKKYKRVDSQQQPCAKGFVVMTQNFKSGLCVS